MKGTQASCMCPDCVACCEQRPGWGTPAEMQAIIDAGHGRRLMKDWWVGGIAGDSDIMILSPAIVSHEADDAPSWPQGRCTFLTTAGLCELHDAGLKPMECREALACQEEARVVAHEAVAASWENDEGKALVDKWDEL